MDAETRARLTKVIRDMKAESIGAVDPETESLREWLKCIEFLWESVGKKIDANNEEDKRFDAYTRLFRDVPIGILEPAIIRAISNNGKYNVIPTPGAIWDAMRKILEVRPEEDIFEAVQMWTMNKWDRCIIRIEAQ